MVAERAVKNELKILMLPPWFILKIQQQAIVKTTETQLKAILTLIAKEEVVMKLS